MLMKLNNEYTHKLLAAEDIFFEMFDANNRKVRPDCSSYLYSHRTNVGMHINFDMHRKQRLLYETAKKATNVLEIGTYLAHSTLIMLLANPKLNIITIDQHSAYSAKPVEVLQKHFPEASVHFVHGLSVNVIPTLSGPFDFFHVDGSHSDDVVLEEIKMCMPLKSTTSNTMFLLDDVKGVPRAQTLLSTHPKKLTEAGVNGRSPNWVVTLAP